MYIQTLKLERKQKQRISRPRWKKKETDLLSWRFECDKCDVRSVAYEVEIKVCFRKSRNISNSSQINLHVNQWYSLTLKSNEPSNMEILKEGRLGKNSYIFQGGRVKICHSASERCCRKIMVSLTIKYCFLELPCKGKESIHMDQVKVILCNISVFGWVKTWLCMRMLF